MRTLLMLLALCASADTVMVAQPAPARDPRFVGHWRLASFVNIDEKGVVTPGRFTGGRIMYDAAGQMAAQLTHADRPAPCPRRRATVCARRPPPATWPTTAPTTSRRPRAR